MCPESIIKPHAYWHLYCPCTPGRVHAFGHRRPQDGRGDLPLVRGGDVPVPEGEPQLSAGDQVGVWDEMREL